MNRAGPTSVTAGVLSAMSRTLPLASNYKYKQMKIIDKFICLEISFASNVRGYETYEKYYRLTKDSPDKGESRFDS